MNARRMLVAVLAFALGWSLACGKKPKVKLSGDAKKEIAALRAEKMLIDEKMRDIENARALIEERNREHLENMRRAIETIQSALGKIQARLDAMEAVQPTALPQKKRLTPPTMIALAVIIILCVVILAKMYSMRMQEKRQPKPLEAPVEPSSRPPDSGPPSS